MTFIANAVEARRDHHCRPRFAFSPSEYSDPIEDHGSARNMCFVSPTSRCHTTSPFPSTSYTSTGPVAPSYGAHAERHERVAVRKPPCRTDVGRQVASRGLPLPDRLSLGGAQIQLERARGITPLQPVVENQQTVGGGLAGRVLPRILIRGREGTRGVHSSEPPLDALEVGADRNHLVQEVETHQHVAARAECESWHAATRARSVARGRSQARSDPRSSTASPPGPSPASTPRWLRLSAASPRADAGRTQGRAACPGV